MHWKAKAVVHKKEKRITVLFEKDVALIARIKQVAGVRWSNTMKYWHVPDSEENRKRFGLPLAYTLLPNNEGIVSIETFKCFLSSKKI